MNMGWLKSLTKKVVKSKFGKAMNTFSAAFSNPVSTIKAITTKATFAELTKTHFEKPLSTQISKTVLSTAAYVGALYGGAAVVGAAKGGTLGALATKIIPTTLKGKIVAAVAVPFAASYIIKKPEIIETAMEAPATAFQAGSIAADPTLEAGIQFVKDHPYFTAAAAATALAGLGYSAVMISRILGKAKKDKPVVIPEIPVAAAPAITAPTEQLITEKPVGITGETPLTPETTTISTGKKPYKRRRAKITPSVRQYVRVNVLSRPVATGLRIINKRYINQELLN